MNAWRLLGLYLRAAILLLMILIGLPSGVLAGQSVFTAGFQAVESLNETARVIKEIPSVVAPAESAFEAPFGFFYADASREAGKKDHLIRGMLIGIVLSIMGYNLIAFFFTRNSSYVFYLLLVTSCLFLHLTLSGYAFASMAQSATRSNNTVISTLGASVALFACLFANSFLKLKQFSRPGWILGLTLTSMSAVVLLLTFLIPYEITLSAANTVALPITLTSIFFGYWLWWRGRKFVRFYCLAWTTGLIGLGLLNAFTLGLITPNALTRNAPQSGFFLFVVFLSAALAEKRQQDQVERDRTQAMALAHERDARAYQEANIRLKEEANRQLEQRVKARTSELNAALNQLQAANDKLLQLSTTDALTQLNNRPLFDNALAIEHRRARRVGGSLALMMFDIDNLKHINDTYGHLAGDACLQALAKLMRPRVLRAGDVLARYGGEEFAILLIDSNLENAAALAEKFRASVEQLEVNYEQSTISFTVSFGVVCGVPGRESTPMNFLVAADKVLALAKEGGRNCVRACTLAPHET